MMKENKYIGHTEFEVEPFQEDFVHKLSWNVLGTRLLQSAYLHASAHGFVLMNIGGETCGWVLSRLNLRMNRRPESGEKFYIETWVDKVYRRFTDRHFTICTSDHTVLGYASSVWALIGMQSRQPIDLEQLSSGDLPLVKVLVDRQRPQITPARIRLNTEQPVRELTAYYSDLDMNGHVNSIRYIDHILDLFSPQMFQTHDVAQLDMIYSNESYGGDKLSICFQQENDAAYDAQVQKQNGDTVCKAHVEFRKNE